MPPYDASWFDIAGAIYVMGLIVTWAACMVYAVLNAKRRYPMSRRDIPQYIGLVLLWPVLLVLLPMAVIAGPLARLWQARQERRR